LNTLEQIELFNIKVNNLTMSETIQIVEKAISDKTQIHYADLNADKVVSLQTDTELKKIYEDSTIINVDGQSVVWASRLLGKPIKERVTGVDLMGELVELAHQKNYKIYLLGAQEEIVTKLKDIYSHKYSPEIIAGYHNGYFGIDDEPRIVKNIVESNPHFLFVAITSPKKEEFLYRNKKQLENVNFIMGVGGSFDVFAGKVKRAPVWMQKIGLEWLFRLIQEPQRMWKRYLVNNSKFILIFFKEYFRRK
jgi:N-acetylglucosaminyldiphosphoundecaprenol N-acetyl-beta-D-mannosaminyltransferase